MPYKDPEAKRANAKQWREKNRQRIREYRANRSGRPLIPEADVIQRNRWAHLDHGPNHNPSGVCLCGCGQPTGVASVTSYSRGYKKGDSLRYVQRHQERKWHLTDYEIDAAGCWNWKGARNSKGYGCYSKDGKNKQAHVASFLANGGTIPEGFVLDHVCRNRACINPAHLEPVTNGENIRRGSKTKLSDAEVIELIQSVRSGRRLMMECSRRFGVSLSYVECLVAGHTSRARRLGFQIISLNSLPEYQRKRATHVKRIDDNSKPCRSSTTTQ